jgi:threonine synthase
LRVEADQVASWIAPCFRAARADDAATLAEIRRVYEQCGQLIDPHTATATAAVRALDATADGRPVVSLATAHPAKFPDAVRQATGLQPSLPAHLAGLLDRPERTDRVANDLAAVQAFVAAAVGP